jgi:hypothetical protein
MSRRSIYLRGQADACRELASTIGDVDTQVELRKLADKFITRAVLNPNEIPPVDPAVARLASKIMFGLTDAPPIGALAEHGPAWSRFFE